MDHYPARDHTTAVSDAVHCMLLLGIQRGAQKEAYIWPLLRLQYRQSQASRLEAAGESPPACKQSMPSEE